jgi:hypothetical protein
MAGCGSKKMAKGGMVSPRKAMAMGKKPQKFAAGGMVAGKRVVNPVKMPRGAGPNDNPNLGSMGPRGAAAGTVQAAPMVRPGTRPMGAAPAISGPKRPGFKKGGMVKKGKK